MYVLATFWSNSHVHTYWIGVKGEKSRSEVQMFHFQVMIWKMIISVVQLPAFMSRCSKGQGAWAPLLASAQNSGLGLRSLIRTPWPSHGLYFDACSLSETF